MGFVHSGKAKIAKNTSVSEGGKALQNYEFLREKIEDKFKDVQGALTK